MFNASCSLGAHLLGALAAGPAASSASSSSPSFASALLVLPPNDHHAAAAGSVPGGSSSSSLFLSVGVKFDPKDKFVRVTNKLLDALRARLPKGTRPPPPPPQDPRMETPEIMAVDLTVVKNKSLPGQPLYNFHGKLESVRVFLEWYTADYCERQGMVPIYIGDADENIIDGFARCCDEQSGEFLANSESYTASGGDESGDHCISQVLGAFGSETNDFIVYRRRLDTVSLGQWGYLLTPEQRLIACRRLAKAVAAVRAAGWVHGSVSRNTVVFEKCGRWKDGWHLVLTDFRCARKRRDAMTTTTTTKKSKPVSATKKPQRSLVPSNRLPGYDPPVLVAKGKGKGKGKDEDGDDDDVFDNEDTYAMGKVFIELICPGPEHDVFPRRRVVVRIADPGDRIDQLPEKVRHLVERCLTTDKNTAITPDEVVEELARMTPEDFKVEADLKPVNPWAARSRTTKMTPTSATKTRTSAPSSHQGSLLPLSDHCSD